MTLYQCDNCLKTFNNSNYHRHMNRKNKCVNITESSLVCKYCDTEYATSFNLKRHLQTCNKNITNINTINSHNTNNSHNTTNITNINNNNNNVAVVPFGKEDISSFPSNDMIKIFKKGHGSIIALFKYTHFNADRPEYHNIYIKSKKEKTIRMFKNREWITIPIGDELHDIVDKYLCHVDIQLESRLDTDPSFRDKLGEKTIKLLQEYCIKLNDNERNEQCLKDLRQQAYIILCDYKYMPQQFDKLR